MDSEQLAKIPPHMRKPQGDCETILLSYKLEASVAGKVVYQQTFEPSGARGDRPLYIYKNLPVQPGIHEVDVSFKAVKPEGGTLAEIGNMDYSYSGRVDFLKSRYRLLTFDPLIDNLVLRQAH